MFGGFGLYHCDLFFGILHKGRLYFKTNDQTRPVYEKYGMKPFRPSAKQTLKNYYEIPRLTLKIEKNSFFGPVRQSRSPQIRNRS